MCFIHRFKSITLTFVFVSIMLLAGTPTSIWPTNAPNDTTIVLRVYGVNFTGTPTITLYNGTDTIIATNVTVVNSNYLTCDINLTGASPGYYNILVNNNEDQDSLEVCFTVIKKLTPPVYIYSKSIYNAGTTLLKMALGDGNNDGKYEIYVGSWRNKIYQLWWDGSWNVDSLSAGNVLFQGVGLGDGNNDGDYEVYGTSNNYHLYQFRWNGSSWDTLDMGGSSTYMARVVIGDVIRDGTFQVYSTDDNGNVFQFIYNGAGYDTTIIATVGAAGKGICIGDGDNDGDVELYVASLSGNVYQISWDGSNWVIDTIGVGSGGMTEIGIGDGDNDGNIEIYACSNDDSVYQFKWNGTAWEKSLVGYGTDKMNDVEVGDGDNDGLNEVYAGCANSILYQFEWDGSSWSDTALFNSGFSIRGIGIGDGNRDGENEIYAACTDGNLYQISYSDTFLFDAGVKEIVSPNDSITPSGEYRVKAIITYKGPADLTFLVHANVIDTTTGTSILQESLTVTMGPSLPETLLTFGTVNLAENVTYNTVVYVPGNDTFPQNDTISIFTTAKRILILYVEDANGYGAPVHPDTIWQIPLVNLLGADRILWMGPTADENEDGPTLDEMKNVDLVIWNCYDYYSEPQLTTNDTINIKQLVADGGKIWLIGQDIYYSLFSKKGNREKGEPIKIDLKAQSNFLGTTFGLETIYEDYLYELNMNIMGIGEALSDTIYVESDFEYDGYLYPDSVGPDTSIAHPILIDPDSNFVIGIARNDSLAAFWAADGRGADTSPGGEWENLIAKMLNFFSVPLGTHEVESQPGIKILSTIGQKVSFIYTGTDNGEVTVSDILGRTVKTFKGLNPGSHVSIKDLPAGIYFVKLKGTDIKKKITIVK